MVVGTSYEWSTYFIVNSGTDGMGIGALMSGVDWAFAGLGTTKVRQDIAIIIVRSKAKVLLIVPMLVNSVMKSIKVYSYRVLD